LSRIHDRPGIALGLSFLFLLAACDGAKTAIPVASVAKTPLRPAYAAEVEKLNAGIEHGIALSAKQIGDTLIPLQVVSLYQERARLTGSYDDYAKAETLLASLPAGPKPSASLCLARARLHYTLHRLKQASAALDTCPTTVEATEMASIRADLALYSGRYREAESVYRALVNDPGIPPNFVRLGLIKKWLGSPGEAAALLEAAEKRYHAGAPTMLAWLKLQRGLVALDRGRFDEALAMYRLASDALDGWWLIDEHIAEVLLLSGKTAEAKQLYENIVARTGNPEFMDALAAMEHQLGNHDNAKKLLQRARAIYEQRLIAFPEAAAGHALDHFLQDETDAKLALALAQKNFATRPYGEAAIALAKAWMLSGKPERAAALIEAQLASGWDTAQAYWILGQALQKLGQQQRADLAKAEALRRNPHSEKMYAYAPSMAVH
jgi:tetratricopeptide (TPR) repeat protein